MNKEELIWTSDRIESNGRNARGCAIATKIREMRINYEDMTTGSFFIISLRYFYNKPRVE